MKSSRSISGTGPCRGRGGWSTEGHAALPPPNLRDNFLGPCIGGTQNWATSPPLLNAPGPVYPYYNASRIANSLLLTQGSIHRGQ